MTSTGCPITVGARSYSTVYCVRQVSCDGGGGGCCLTRCLGFHADMTSGSMCTRSPAETFMTAATSRELKILERLDFSGGHELFFPFHIGHSANVTWLYCSRVSQHIPKKGPTDR